MPRDRFELIFWMLHVSHSTTSPQKCIDKIRMLLEMMLTEFQANYNPRRNLAVDETMLRFRGQFGGKQCMPKKPVKWGIKATRLSFDSSNGYLFNVLLYSGAETLDEANPLFSTLPQPARVVIHLLEPYLHRGHHVFTDLYYSSINIPLAKTLHDNQTAFTGTSVRDRMDLPDQGPIMVCTQEKSAVVMLSTESSARMVIVPARHSQAGEQKKPLAVHTYNQHMNGVDIADQYNVSYPLIRKTVKWWRKVFFWLMDVSVTNSYALYGDIQQSPKSHITYRRSIVDISLLLHSVLE